MSGWDFLIMARLFSLKRVFYGRSLFLAELELPIFAAPTESLVSKKSPTGPTERTPKPEKLIALATSLGVRW